MNGRTERLDAITDPSDLPRVDGVLLIDPSDRAPRATPYPESRVKTENQLGQIYRWVHDLLGLRVSDWFVVHGIEQGYYYKATKLPSVLGKRHPSSMVMSFRNYLNALIGEVEGQAFPTPHLTFEETEDLMKRQHDEPPLVWRDVVARFNVVMDVAWENAVSRVSSTKAKE